MTTILVAEDTRVNQITLKHVLTKQGYGVLMADDGQLALDALKEIAVDLVITDIGMPNMDGFGLTKAIRTTDNLSELPIIMLTASADDDDQLAAIEAQVDAFLTRPFDSQQLTGLVAQLLA